MADILTMRNPFFGLCGDWLKEIRNRKMLSKMKKERNNFTSTLIFHSYYYYASQFFFDSLVIIKEIRCLDLTYLMEQRLRYTKIRDELELPHLMGELRRKCEKCLKISDGEEEKDPESGKSGGGGKSETEEFAGTSKKTAGEKSDSQQQKRRKSRKKAKKSKDLKVLKRFWFKRKSSPPPQNELEQHLHELRMRTRKEMHTLLFLNSAAKETKIKKARKYAALLNKKSKREWFKYLELLEKKHEILGEEAVEYNTNDLMERLERSPELLEAVERLKDMQEPLRDTVMKHSYEIATRMERQFFSLIPGVTGLTTYRNAMICEIARDEAILASLQ
ncbi:unnamed protein product [Litomosoides sigmodontis]|uniref:Uncharacterized protein n=1 Tax=Litomosoides sigmodontis TaxID=42156 RepID=A0A3P6TJE8_LITSI|nr:unnamed protein product [Litomosoides sigmodontis]